MKLLVKNMRPLCSSKNFSCRLFNDKLWPNVQWNSGCNLSKIKNNWTNCFLAQFSTKLNNFFINFWEYVDTKSTIIYTYIFLLKMRKMLTSFRALSQKSSNNLSWRFHKKKNFIFSSWSCDCVWIIVTVGLRF